MNNTTKSALKLSLVAAALSTSFANAEESYRQHDAHVHGVVEFNIAQDGNEMLIEISAPGADIVGFEHAPKSDQDHKAIKDAEVILEKAESVFTFTAAANCSVEYTAVTNTLESEPHVDHHDHGDHEEHHDEHKDHAEHEEHHDEHHDHAEHEEHHDEHHDHADHEEHHDEHKDHGDHEEHHDEHDDHEGHDHKEGSSHGAFTIEYHFECESVEKLSSIETTWFSHFPTTEKVTVNLLTDTAQKAVELSSKSSTIKF